MIFVTPTPDLLYGNGGDRPFGTLCAESLRPPVIPPGALAHSLPLVEELPRARDAWDVFRAVSRLPHALFLDSSLRHAHLGRYSYVTADPFAFFRSTNGKLEARGPVSSARSVRDPFVLLKNVLSEWQQERVPGLPPFQGGMAGLFGYDLCHHIERLPRPRHRDFDVPDLAVGFYDWVIAFDHEEERGWVISTGLPEHDRQRRRERAAQRLRHVRSHLHRPSRDLLGVDYHRSPIAPAWPLPDEPAILSNFRRDDYLHAVERAIAYVHAGDCFQVNIAQRLLFPQHDHPVTLFHRLRQCNPSTFGGYFDTGDFTIVSASPERFLRLDPKGRVETRPIKGTRPRGDSRKEDERLMAELRSSSKDRAENIMIVDLLRNDLGRVCEYGSIHVPSLCSVETYQTVHHLVSTVTGRLRPSTGPLDLLRAAFPGGSVTGAPKVRAMEIIAELEPTAHGAYCGSLGWIGFDGGMDTNILIRTFTVGDGWVQFPVGGGIVADSEPEREYEETLHKAAGMIRALV